jgi:hypothetical protein
MRYPLSKIVKAGNCPLDRRSFVPAGSWLVLFTVHTYSVPEHDWFRAISFARSQMVHNDHTVNL